MASMGYPPFSAPATFERRKKAKGRSWLRSAKEVFMKPWKRQPASRRPQRPQHISPHQNPLLSPGGNPYEQQPGFNFAKLKSRVEEDFPASSQLYGDNVQLPFSGNRLSPDGGPGASSKESGSEAEIKIPETAYGSRPPLTNIFSMSDKSNSSTSVTIKSSSNTSVTNKSSSQTPSTTSHPPVSQQTPRPSTHLPSLPITTSSPHAAAATSPQVIATPDPTSPAHLYAMSSAQYNQRRHSTPITSSLSAPATPRDHRRPSASSDITIDKLRNHRRDRRSSGTREIPLLPKRGQDPFQCSSHSSTLSTPEHSVTVTPYSEYAGSYTSAQLQHQQMAVDPAQVALGMMVSSAASPSAPSSASSQRPPVSPGGQQGIQPPTVAVAAQVAPQPVLLPPHAELQDLQEELDDDDEPDGAENFLSMIEEMEEVEYPQYPPRNFNPIAQTRQQFVPAKVKEEPSKPPSGGGLGFGVKKGLRLSSKKQDKKNKDAQQPAIPAHLQDAKDKDSEFKGFDGFFLY